MKRSQLAKDTQMFAVCAKGSVALFDSFPVVAQRLCIPEILSCLYPSAIIASYRSENLR